ncbi:EVE domain-containing protein [Pseudomonas mangrovi]|uniref:EVE domain-containing protein n=1 Tax=Pseudomonas mangrovi TaxID=2161748 RepID=A0A2T5PBD8_9PSED|nr:EVE domain-containing protein [Pseudomonas mangrovi]PTU75060.1 EVE domain-containing protein [Pseudomonas mangrovi]
MPTWLMKSEPDELSIQELARQGQARWDGVRNFQARNYLRAMQEGDLFLFYHSSCAQPGVAGIGRIVQGAYPDPSACDPQSPYHDPRTASGKNLWSAVDVAFEEAFPEVLALSQIKLCDDLKDLPLVQKGSRLSVMPVNLEHWDTILRLARQL